MAHSCNPYKNDERVIRRTSTFKSIELNLKFHDETDTNLSIAISKEIQNEDKEKVRLELRNGEQLVIFDGKGSLQKKSMKFSILFKTHPPHPSSMEKK